jgi:S-formylglutathione hydrolase FrmB
MLEGVEMKENRLINLLNAEGQRAVRLACMQLEIEEGNFDEAMGYQFEYLYWHDEFIELLDEHHNEWWALKLAVLGVEC